MIYVLEKRNTNICCQKQYTEVQRVSTYEQGQMDCVPQRRPENAPYEARQLRI